MLAAAITRLKAFETRESEAKALADGLLHHPRIGGRPLEGLAGRVETAVAQRRQEHHALDPDGTFQDRRSRTADTVARANVAIEVAETTVRLPRTDLAAAEAALAEAEQVVAKAREDLEVAERTLVH